MNHSSFQNAKMVFIGGPNKRIHLLHAVAKRLQQEHNVDYYFLQMMLGDDILLSDVGISSDKQFSLPVLSFTRGNYDLDYLRACEKKYGINIWSSWQINAVRSAKRQTLSEDRILPWVEAFFRSAEKMFDTIKPDFLVHVGIVGGIALEILFRIAQQRGVEILQITNARIRGRITIDNSLTDTWPLLVKRYNDIRQNGLSDQLRLEAEEFVKEFRLKTPQPSRSVSVKVNHGLGKKISRVFEAFRMIYLRRAIPQVSDQLIWPITDKLLTNSPLFEDPVQGEKFAFFPLHYQPEASTSLWGKWHVDQPTLIEKISKALPVGYKLYVKEHTKGATGRPRGFYRKIKNLPNVRLIRPTANTFDLIKQSSIIVTITGTVGWEGILFQKPVFTFGDIFYNVFEQTVEVKDISQLPALFLEHLDSSLDYNKLLEFVGAMLSSTFLGSAMCPGECKDFTLNDDNVKLIVSCMENHLRGMSE